LLKLLLKIGGDLAGGLRRSFARLGRIGQGALLYSRGRPRQGGRCPGQLRRAGGAGEVLPDPKAPGQEHYAETALQQKSSEARGWPDCGGVAGDRM
jgi:hypothetical protein